MATSAKEADKYKCLKDFSGKPVFFTAAGFHELAELAAHLQGARLRLQARADRPQGQLRCPAAAAPSSARRSTPRPGRSLAPYWKETEVRMDISVVNPCPDEIAKLKAAGLVDCRGRSEGRIQQGRRTVKEILGRADPVRLQRARRICPKHIVYKMLKAFYENREKLGEARSRASTPWRRTSSACRSQGINANAHIPVHAGLAKFLKEHKAWDDKWKVAARAADHCDGTHSRRESRASRASCPLQRICGGSIKTIE